MFNHRSNQKELLDADDIPDADLFQNLKELNFINAVLGGYNITFNALKKTLKKDKVYNLIDIGSGGGDTLKQIKKWNQKHGFQFKLSGIDLKQTCIDYAIINEPEADIKFICDDYKKMHLYLDEISIIHACLFCHHLSETEIIELINFAQKRKSVLIINDLERNPIAYYAIKILTRLFSHSYLVKNDAPLSVLRGFTKQEWLKIIQKSEAKKYSVNNKWAFRHEIIIEVNEG